MQQPKLEFARKLRKDMSLPEMLIWGRIKIRHKGGQVFRRQYPYGPYLLDSYCAKARLCIEIDGYAHGTQNRGERDEARDAYLKAQRIETLRIPAADVLADPDEIAGGIYLMAIERLRLRESPALLSQTASPDL